MKSIWHLSELENQKWGTLTGFFYALSIAHGKIKNVKALHIYDLV